MTTLSRAVNKGLALARLLCLNVSKITNAALIQGIPYNQEKH